MSIVQKDKEKNLKRQNIHILSWKTAIQRNNNVRCVKGHFPLMGNILRLPLTWGEPILKGSWVGGGFKFLSKSSQLDD